MYKPAVFSIFLCLCFAFSALGQSGSQQPELQDPRASQAAGWERYAAGSYSAFVSDNLSFPKSDAPAPAQVYASWSGEGWKGERIHTQALIWTTNKLDQASLEVSPLYGEKQRQIPAKNVQASFVRYVLADHLGALSSGCGIPQGLDTSLQADLIDHQLKEMEIPAGSSRPVWLSVDIPRDAEAGIYSGTLTVRAQGYEQILPFSVTVLKPTLPPPAEWSFHLDLWQNPYSVARYYKVEPWSDEHLEAMRPYMQMLADAGQKSITTTLIYDPWNAQTYDIYGSMVKWTKKRDGDWTYDFSIFDRWVNFMMDVGIDKYINAYSMIPWNLKFYYFDEASGSEQVLIADPESPEYKAHWQPMLAAFAKHLKEKGWFEKTMIAMDERPEKHMMAVIDIIRAADPDFQISMAGNYHESLQGSLLDYSVASDQTMPDEVLAERNAKGYTTTFYTCCAEPYPNTFTSSPYAESTWLAWHSLHKSYGGYLRWAYNCWNEDPLRDTRFRSWSSGDTYLVYPGVRSSIRFERLKEGIQDFEKVRILRAEYSRSGDTGKLRELEQAIEHFDLSEVKDAENSLRRAKAALNRL